MAQLEELAQAKKKCEEKYMHMLNLKRLANEDDIAKTIALRQAKSISVDQSPSAKPPKKKLHPGEKELMKARIYKMKTQAAWRAKLLAVNKPAALKTGENIDHGVQVKQTGKLNQKKRDFIGKYNKMVNVRNHAEAAEDALKTLASHWAEKDVATTSQHFSFPTSQPSSSTEPETCPDFRSDKRLLYSTYKKKTLRGYSDGNVTTLEMKKKWKKRVVDPHLRK